MTDMLLTAWWSLYTNGIWQVWWGIPGQGEGWYYNELTRRNCWRKARGPFKTRRAAMLAAEAEAAGDD